MYYKWLADHIREVGKNTPWVNGVATYKLTLEFFANSCWSIVMCCIRHMTNNNTLGATNATLVVSLMEELEINILCIIAREIQD